MEKNRECTICYLCWFVYLRKWTCHNNPEKSSTTKINENTASGYLLFTRCSFDVTENKLDYYRGKDGMKKVLQRFKRACNKNNKLWKKDNDIINLWINKTSVIYVKKNLVMIKKSQRSLSYSW